MNRKSTRVASLLCSLIMLFAASVNGQLKVISYWDFNQTQPSGGGGGDSLGTAYSYSNNSTQDAAENTYQLVAPYTTLPINKAYIKYVRPKAIQTTPFACTIRDSILDNVSPTGPAIYCYINDLHILGNDSGGAAAGNLGIRARNPSENSYMYLYMPTTGYFNIVMNYAVSASSSKGADYNILSYSTNSGTTWKNLTRAMDTFNISGVYRPDTLQVINPTTAGSNWYPVKINFSSDPSVNDNADFILRWQYEGTNSTGTSGNDRYDNISVSGDSICPVITLQPANVTACANGSTFFRVHATGYMLTYQWEVNTGSGYTNTSNIGVYSGATSDSLAISNATGLSTYQYKCVVSNTLCSSITSNAATLTLYPAIVPGISSSTDVTCSGNGSATASASGGTSPYTYSWSDSQTTATATNLSVGTYTVTVRDADACNATTSISIIQSSGVSTTVTVISDVSCNGGSNGAAAIIASGGSTPYTYSWSGGAGTNLGASGLSAEIYTVTVTDKTGCNGIANVTITQPTALSVAASVTANTCYQEENGRALATPSGGSSPYTYSWSDGGATNLTASGLSAGNYTVTVKDICGGSATSSITISQPATALSTTASVTANNLCNGTNNGSASATPSGGSSPYTYSWSGGGGADSTASGLTGGNYTVTVKDLCSNSATASVSITQPAGMTITIDSIVPTSHCNGVAEVIPSGGTSPYTYSWSGGQTTNTVTGLCAGDRYCCTVTGANGCSDTACISIVITGIPGISNPSAINIYPDPNTGYFTITGIIQGQVIELYNYLGQNLISKMTEDNSPMHFDISNKPNGIYLIRIENKDGTVVTQKKIVKTQ